MSDMPSPELLRQLLSYDPDTGTLTWRKRSREFFKTDRDCAAWNTRFEGKTAGTFEAQGYVQVNVFGTKILGHKIAWAIYYNKFPDFHIDHIDGERSNNAILNLRDVCRVENMKNQKRASNNKSGCTGVSFCNTRKMWQSIIHSNKKRFHLGFFESLDDAIAARRKANMKYGFHENHGRD